MVTILHCGNTFNKIANHNKLPTRRVDKEAIIGLSNDYSPMCKRSHILISYLNEFTLLAFTQPVDNLFHACVILGENGYFVIYILVLIRRNIIYRESKLITSHHKAIIMPHLEYCIHETMS